VAAQVGHPRRRGAAVSADIYEQIRQALDTKPDVDKARHEALRLVKLRDDRRPGEPPPDNGLDGRWRRALAENPDGVLGALLRQRDPASARVFGNQKEFELTLPDGGGRLIVKWIPDGC
jgi:hypothetical protein